MYFEIQGGPVLEAIKAWEAGVKESRQKAVDLAREIGAQENGVWIDGQQRIVGFSFTGAVPMGFRQYKKDMKGLIRPDLSTKAGRVFDSRLSSIQPPDHRPIKEMIGPQMVPAKDERSRSGLALVSAHWRIFGGHYVAVVPVEKGKDYIPPNGFKPLTLSEHFQLKKSEGA